MIALTTALVVLPALSSAAENAQPPAAAFYALIGTWSGQGELGESGQTPAKLAIKLNCQKTSAGFGVSCLMNASNKEMSMAETDLFGHDPVSNTYHWYSVTNTGETHDHKAQWIDAQNMKANYSWSQDGAKMAEKISFKFKGHNSILFESVVSQNGQEVARFTGNMKK